MELWRQPELSAALMKPLWLHEIIAVHPAKALARRISPNDLNYGQTSQKPCVRLGSV
jgi:hypothetical protein